MTVDMTIGGRQCRLFGAERPSYLLIQPSARHENAILEEEFRRTAALSPAPFALLTICLDDWITDLLPWQDRNISRDAEAGKHAEDTLELILSVAVPELRERYGPLPVILGGYSLGGLFALWASSRSDCFKAVAAASPSVWIRDWLPFARKNVPRAKFVYLSLGDREEHVRNQAIARVGDCLRAYYEMLQEQLGTGRCALVMEEGNHFSDNDGRLARAFSRCMAVLESVLQNPA